MHPEALAGIILQAEASTTRWMPGKPAHTFSPPPTLARVVVMQHKAAKFVNASLRAWIAGAGNPHLHYCAAGDDLPPDLFPGGVARWGVTTR